MHGVQRPLSPYWIYRWEITMWLSSLHRITGLILSLGAVALAVWPFCFFYHLANGVRHLAWDAGYGFDPKRIRASGWTVVIVTFVATAAFSYAAII